MLMDACYFVSTDMWYLEQNINLLNVYIGFYGCVDSNGDQVKFLS